MPPPKHPHWPSDDQIREQANDREFSDDGRKLTDSERVGGLAPDADPEPSAAARPAAPPVITAPR